MVNTLLNAGVQPIMVFDGQRLPSKAITESKRHENRQKYKNKAKECLIKGDIRGARECFQRCTEVTPQMALEVIQACRKLGVDCIVAPYEADAQLAYLCQIGVSQVVITEDSDLVLFGCERIIFKMDVVGNGILVERSKLLLCLGSKAENFTFDKFRYMCIMSGCDYLPSLHGIGLGKSLKFFSKTTNPNLQQVLAKIPVYLNMSNLAVTKEYITNFLQADQTFLYQLVYDPLKRKLVPLNPYPPDLDPKELHYAGPHFADHLAYQIALGNVSVDSLKTVDNFNPDKDNTITKARKRKSIWDPTYSIPSQQPIIDVSKANDSISTISSQILPSITLSTPKQFSRRTSTSKRTLSDECTLTDDSIFGMYGSEVTEGAKRCKLEPMAEPKPAEKRLAISLSPKIVKSRYFASPSEEKKNVEVGESLNNLSSCEDIRTSPTTSVMSCNLENSSPQFSIISKHLAENTPSEQRRLSPFEDTQDINLEDETLPGRNGGSLFFDKAVASKNPFYAAKTTVQQESPSPTMHSRKNGNFGKWSSLHKYFSFSTLDSISKSPKNHTEFKQVVKQSKAGDILKKDNDSRQHNTECKINLSQNSQTSTSTSSSQSISIGTQSSEMNSSQSDNICFLQDDLDEDNDENILKGYIKVADLPTQVVTSSPKKADLPALTARANTNAVCRLSRFRAAQPKKLVQLPTRKHLGLKKQKSSVGSQHGLIKQSSLKEMFSKFNFVRSK